MRKEASVSGGRDGLRRHQDLDSSGQGSGKGIGGAAQGVEVVGLDDLYVPDSWVAPALLMADAEVVCYSLVTRAFVH